MFSSDQLLVNENGTEHPEHEAWCSGIGDWFLP